MYYTHYTVAVQYIVSYTRVGYSVQYFIYTVHYNAQSNIFSYMSFASCLCQTYFFYYLSILYMQKIIVQAPSSAQKIWQAAATICDFSLPPPLPPPL